MCAELTVLGLPEPEYEAVSFMLRCTVRAAEVREQGAGADVGQRDARSTDDGKTVEATQETRVKTRVKTRVTTGGRIIEFIKANPSVTREELAHTLGLTIKGVDWQIASLKTSGALRRVGPSNGGHWEVVGNAKEEK